jgi:hypothetical protein
MRAEARKVTLEASILRFKRAREASAAAGGSRQRQRLRPAGHRSSLGQQPFSRPSQRRGWAREQALRKRLGLDQEEALIADR